LDALRDRFGSARFQAGTRETIHSIRETSVSTAPGSGGLDSREPKLPPIKPRDMYEPDLHIDTLKGKARNFR
jgi:hypothetical protein